MDVHQAARNFLTSHERFPMQSLSPPTTPSFLTGRPAARIFSASAGVQLRTMRDCVSPNKVAADARQLDRGAEHGVAIGHAALSQRDGEAAFAAIVRALDQPAANEVEAGIVNALGIARGPSRGGGRL